MRIDIDARVKTQEGEEIGSVDRVILNPYTREVDAIVVHRGRILTRDVVVPLSLVQRSDEEGVQLRIGRYELQQLPDFVERHYAAMPGQARVPYPYAPGSILFPLGPAQGVSGLPSVQEAAEDEVGVPSEDVDVAEGTEVRALDGLVGFVDEVLTDSSTNRATDIVVRKGIVLTKDVTIPMEYVSELTDDHLQLSLTVQQVEELPTPSTDRYLTIEGRGGEKEGES